MIYAVVFLTVALVVSLFANFWRTLKSLSSIGEVNKLDGTLSQSEQHFLRSLHDDNFRPDKKVEKDYEEEGVPVEMKVALYNGKAYWLEEDGLRTAPVDEDEEVIYEDQQPVNAVDMSRKEAETIMEIIDALRSE